MLASKLAEKIDADLVGNPSIDLTGCASLDDAGPGEVGFLNNPVYGKRLADCKADALIVRPRDRDHAPDGATLLLTDNPYLAFRNALIALHGFRQQPGVGVHENAYVHDTAEIGELCTIRPGAYVAPNAIIGDRCILYPGSYVGRGVRVGNDCVIYPNVSIYTDCKIGDRCILHANNSVGQDGFGYATAHSERAQRVIHHRIPQVGNVIIEDDVEIGANCSIDRATMGSTVIGAGTKMSNQVVIGHGAKIGKHNLFVALCGVAGSTKTGDHCTFGGQVGIGGHLTIGDRVRVAASSHVMTDIPDGEEWGGTPARPFTHAKRVALQQQKLPDMAAELKKLRKRVEALEANSSA